MALTFTRLGTLVVLAPPPYVFLVGGLLSPFSNCPLLIASSILIRQSHSSPNELIGDDKKPTIISRKQVLDDHVDLVLLIWPINHSRCLGLPSSHLFRKCLPYTLFGSLQIL